VLDEDVRMRPSGLEAMAKLGGIELNQDLVVEADPDARLASGIGESFYALVKEHPITQGLTAEKNQPAFKVLVTNAQSLTKSGNATELLASSDQAFSLRDIRPFMQQAVIPS